MNDLQIWGLIIIAIIMFISFVSATGHFIASHYLRAMFCAPQEIPTNEIISEIEAPSVFENIEPEMHKATLERIRLHEALYLTLWKKPLSIPVDFYGDTKMLCLPLLPAKRAVITEIDNRKTPAVSSLKKEVPDVRATIETQVDASCLTHEELLTQSFSENQNDEPYIDMDYLTDGEVINTTTSESNNTSISTKGSEKMDQRPFSEFREDVAKEAHRCWLDIFSTYIGTNEAETWGRKRNTTCPECGRNQKYYMVNSDTGATHCASSDCNTHCHDGFSTIALFTAEKYGKIVRKIAEDFGLVTKTGTKLKEKKAFKESPPQRTTMTKGELNYFKMITNKSKKLTKRSLPYKYLLSRGIPTSIIDKSIHQLFGMESLAYVDEEGNKGRYPALLTPISKDGELIGYHRIYLTSDGKKLQFDEAKKPTGNFPGAYSGAVIKLGGSVMKDGIYRIAEGVETSLAVTALYGKPCWPTMTAVGIQTFILPSDCKKLIIYADLDLSKTGEIVSNKLVARLQVENPEVTVEIEFPPQELWDLKSSPKGIDFLDVLTLTQKNTETV